MEDLKQLPAVADETGSLTAKKRERRANQSSTANPSSVQVTKWREKKRETFGGMKEASVWATDTDAANLRAVFRVLADSALGPLYRRSLKDWQWIGQRLQALDRPQGNAEKPHTHQSADINIRTGGCVPVGGLRLAGEALIQFCLSLELFTLNSQFTPP